MERKIKIALLALLALTLTGCEDNKTQQQIDVEIASEITEFNDKPHRYLKYYHRAGNATVAGITHDPECPCYKKGGSEHGEG